MSPHETCVDLRATKVSPGRWHPGTKLLQRTSSPVSVLDSPQSQPPLQTEPTTPASLRHPHRLASAQELIALLADASGRQQVRQRSPLDLQVTAGGWTAERRAAYREAAAGQPGLLLPEEAPQVARLLQQEAAAILLLLRTRPIRSLHFCTPPGVAVISGRRTTEALHRALASWAFRQLQAGCLRELAVHDWLATRECCQALPALAGSLRRLLLSGCRSRVDLAPLAQLHALEDLVLQTDAAPDLASLPAGLRRLELEVAGLGTRAHLPGHLRLELLRVACPGGRVFLDAPTVMQQCREVQLECGTALFMGLLDTDACSGRSLVRIGAAALLAAFYRLPVQQVRVQASGLAFSRPAAVSRLARPSQQQPCWPHQLRYVQSASLGSLLDAALPYWQQVEAVRMQHQRAEAPVVQQAAGCGVQLSKRDSLRGAYRLPPLGQLGAADLHFLAALAVPTELRFHPGCLKEHQHSLLSNRTFQLRAAPHLRHLHNIQLHEGSDLSMLQLDSLSGDWSSGCCPPTWPLPAGVREVVLTAGSPGTTLDGTSLLAGLSGSLTARGFAAVCLPPSSHPLQLELQLSGGIVSDATLHLGGRADRLFLRVAAAAQGGCTWIDAGGAWLGQAGLAVIDLQPTGVRSAGSAGSCRTGTPVVSELAFPGRCLADLFRGALRSAAAGGLRRLELVCGSGMQHFGCTSLRLVAYSSSSRRCFSLKDLRRLPPAQLGGWQLHIAAEPWRVCLTFLEP